MLLIINLARYQILLVIKFSSLSNAPHYQSCSLSNSPGYQILLIIKCSSLPILLIIKFSSLSNAPIYQILLVIKCSWLLILLVIKRSFWRSKWQNRRDKDFITWQTKFSTNQSKVLNRSFPCLFDCLSNSDFIIGSRFKLSWRTPTRRTMSVGQSEFLTRVKTFGNNREAILLFRIAISNVSFEVLFKIIHFIFVCSL
jgi:hypothetical protein